MANLTLTSNSHPQPYGLGGRRVFLPVQATAQVIESGMAAQINGACVAGTTAGSGNCIGVYESNALGGATDGAIRVSVLTDQIFLFNAGTLAPTDATPYGTILYMEDDNHVGTGNGTQTQIAGEFRGMQDDGLVRVYISGNAVAYQVNAAAPSDGGTPAFKARAVITTLQAYGGTTTGVLTQTTLGSGLSAADGVTLAAGDVVFIQEGTTNLTAASDAGPYVVTAVGSASVKWVLTRPSWWQTGATMVPGQVVSIGGEGTFWAGTSWKTFAAKGSVVDTTAPSFWVDRVTQQITFVAGNNGTAVVNNVGIRSASKSNVATNVISVSGTNTGITNFASLAMTPGALGTATFTLTAIGTALASIAVATTSVVNVTITNW